MSLISEALKKARGDTSGPYAVAHPPPRRSVAPWLTAALALGVAAGVVIGVVVRRDSAANDETTRVDRADMVTAGPAAPGAAAPADSPAEAPAPAASRTPAAERETATASDVQGSEARTATPTPIDGRDSPQAPSAVSDESPADQAPRVIDHESVATQAPPSPQPVPAAEARPDSTSAPTQPTTTIPPQEAGPADGASYHREVMLPGGVHLALGGIAWSQGNPAALVNGQVLGPGEGDGEWTLTAVDRDRVEIEWRGVRFFLLLK